VREILDTRHLRTNGRFPEWASDDPVIKGAFKFLRQWDQLGREETNQRQLLKKRQDMYVINPELYLAHDLAFSADSERHRYELEARLLARQSNEEIAHELSGLAGMVEWYEQLFFNVRDRIDNRGYIVNKVICPSVIEPS
jgi:hypothetical protein